MSIKPVFFVPPAPHEYEPSIQERFKQLKRGIGKDGLKILGIPGSDKPLSDTTVENNTKLVMKFVDFVQSQPLQHPVKRTKLIQRHTKDDIVRIPSYLMKEVEVKSTKANPQFYTEKDDKRYAGIDPKTDPLFRGSESEEVRYSASVSALYVKRVVARGKWEKPKYKPFDPEYGPKGTFKLQDRLVEEAKKVPKDKERDLILKVSKINYRDEYGEERTIYNARKRGEWMIVKKGDPILDKDGNEKTVSGTFLEPNNDFFMYPRIDLEKYPDTQGMESLAMMYEPWMFWDLINNFLSHKPMSDSTKRNYWSVLNTMARWSNPRDEDYYEGIRLNKKNQAYYDMIQKYQKKIIKDREARKVSPKKVSQQVTEESVRQVIEAIRADGHEAEALIMEILLKYPYRAEIGTLRLISKEAYDKLVSEVGGQNLKENYLVMNKVSGMRISRSNYKTFSTYGTIVNMIKDKYLQKALRSFVKARKISEGELVFGFETAQATSQRLFYLTQKYNNGMSLGPAALVKIMLSSQQFASMAEAADFLKESSRIRGTSLSVLQDVYLHKAKLEE